VNRLLTLSHLLLLSGSVLAEPPTFEQNGRIRLEGGLRAIQYHRKYGENFPDPVGEVLLFRVRYDSVGLNQKPVRLSGLVALPATGAPKGVVLYYHGTTADRRLSPSRYGPKQFNAEAESAALAFACGGYALLMPDYLGLGDDPGVHPYPWATSNVASGVDLLRAVRESKSLPAIGSPLFLSGYSEGGAVAMATARYLESAGRAVPTRSAPLSGPYDLSVTTANSILRGRQAAFPLSLKLFLLSYAAYATAKLHPELNLKDYFAPSFATYIPYVFEQGWPDSEIIYRLLTKAWQLGAIQSTHKVLTWRYRQALKNRDTQDPVLAELRRHDVYDWAPKNPMLMVYLPTDSVVVAENTLLAEAAMRRRGVSDQLVRKYAIPQSGLNHLTAMTTAILIARRFFDEGFGSLDPKPRK
jgi:alpha-beta hydrolase superfamily lysophospholipase